MTDDFSPVEYNWAWKSRPHVRLSFEPIGRDLDKTGDPYNQKEAMRCISEMQWKAPSAHWTSFDCLRNSLFTDQYGTKGTDGVMVGRPSDPSSCFLAAESSP